jgi:4-hydroxybenzoate polyprenyltransferase
VVAVTAGTDLRVGGDRPPAHDRRIGVKQGKMEFSPRKCLYAAIILAAFAILSITLFGLLGRRSIIGFALAVLFGVLIGRWIR